jgi:hypothetical protein
MDASGNYDLKVEFLDNDSIGMPGVWTSQHVIFVLTERSLIFSG